MLNETVRKLALIGIAQRIATLTQELTDLRATANQLETNRQDKPNHIAHNANENRAQRNGEVTITDKRHWTQRPENARKVARMHRKASATRKAARHAS